MRLLIATYARGAVGGVETYLRGITPGLIARGHTVGLICEHRFEEAGTSAADPYAACAAEWCVEERGLKATLAGTRAWRPDLIWSHGLESAELEAGLLELAPAMLFAHNYDGTCATGAKFHRWPHAQPCARTMGAACAAINFTRHCGLPNPAGFATSWRRQRQRARQFGRYQRILVASRHMAEEFKRPLARLGMDVARLRRLAYPLLGERVEAPEPRPHPPSTLLMLSRLTVAKGGSYLLRSLALAEVQLGRRLTLTVAGEGPERERLREQAQQLALNVDFPGWIWPAERRRQLAAADLLVVPSLWPEPFGMVGLEAAAQGVPAVAFAVGGIPDWLRPGENGELAPAAPPTVAGLAAALVRALNEPAHWERLRHGAWERSADYALERHLECLEAILSGQDRGGDD